MAHDQNNRTLPGKHKALFALPVLLIFLVLLEIVLRGFGLFAPEKTFTVFTGADGRPRVRYELNGLKPEFSPEKEKGALRIMIAGGSTALGFPYHPRSSIGARLAALLEDSLPEGRVEVINLGRMGMDSAEVEAVVREALGYGPDLVIVYSGQNEFISQLRATPVLKALEGIKRGSGLGRIRVARMIGRAADLLAGGAMLTTMKSVDENADVGLTLPPPAPLSAAVYQKVLDDYRRSMEKIARDCRARGVPVILSTMASNLRDWPPDLRSVPPAFPEMYRRDALEAILKAREMTETSEAAAGQPVPGLHHGAPMPPIDDTMMNYEEALKILAQARERYPGYAAISFELGRIKTALVEMGMKRPDRDEDRLVLDGDSARPEEGGEPEKVMGLASDLPVLDPAYQEKLRAEALSDFKRARDEEARVVMSNRAPSAINEIVREVARSDNVLLLDTEKLIEESSYLAPGFDWFDDHCHPNLWGQQVIAEAFYDLIRESAEEPGGAGPEAVLGGVWSKLPWAEPSPWDEQAFLASHEVDDHFLHNVFLRLGIYLGLEKDLPGHSRATRERLSRAAEKDPADPLPVVLEALVAADYGESAEAAGLLRTVYVERLSDLGKCLARYFASADLRQGVFMARLRPGPGNPPLRGLLKSGMFESEEGKSHELTQLALDRFTFFLDLDAGGADISGAIRQGLDNRARYAEQRQGKVEPLILADAEKVEVLDPGPGAKLTRVGQTAQYSIETGIAFITTGPVQINPLAFDRLALKLGKNIDARSFLGIEWIYLDYSGKTIACDMKIPLDSRPREETHYIGLSGLPRWVLAREVREIRLTPGSPGNFDMYYLKLEHAD
ncbi:MAG TPA: SGNH/GDSL hydrolase family protein [bacterium]|nr:SGNH/GDSL hydrolase family protein [bacterium]